MNELNDDTYQPSPLPEPAILRRLPWILAIINMVVSIPVAIIEVVGIKNGWRLEILGCDWPFTVLFLLNFPVSLLAFGWLALLSGGSRALANFSLVGMVAFSTSTLLLTGIVWYYLIGCGLRRFIRRRRNRRGGWQGFEVIVREDKRTK